MHAAVGLSCSSVCFFVLHSCRPLSARLASHFSRAGVRASSRPAAGVRARKLNSLTLRVGEREPGAGGLGENERCTGCLIVLLVYEV